MSNTVIVTTGDLKQDYDVIGPVYFQISNKGLFNNQLAKLVDVYSKDIQLMKKQGQMSQFKADWGFLYGEYSVGQSNFEQAFFVSVQELKKRAAIVGADAIICMRQDIDLDTTGFQYFYLQMYGTAVKFRLMKIVFSSNDAAFPGSEYLTPSFIKPQNRRSNYLPGYEKTAVGANWYARMACRER